MYIVTILIYIIIKIITKINILRVLFVSSIPLFFIATLNVYSKVVQNEVLLSHLTIHELWQKNIINTLFCNICCHLMNFLVKL
jgi:cell shape-determining protein MreD